MAAGDTMDTTKTTNDTMDTIESTKDTVDTIKDIEDGMENDKSFLLLLMFYVLGTVSLVPQFFYITAYDYWLFKFRNLSGNMSDTDTRTELQKNFAAYYSTVANICTNVFVFLTIIVSPKISLQPRIIGSLVIMTLFFFVTLIFIWIDTDSWQNGFFNFSLVIGGVLSSTSGCLIISVYDLSSKFPPVYLGTQLSGQAICGILAVLTQIFTLSLDVSSKSNATIYFSICASLTVATVVFYVLVFYRSRSFQIYLNREVAKQKIDFSNFKLVIRKMATCLIALVIAASSAVLVFPGVTSLVESTGKGTNRWSDVFFIPVCSFLSYHTFDFAGREVALRWIRLKNTYVVLTASILRLGFIPMIMLCNAQPRDHLPVVFEKDYLFILFVILFAFTNGYFINLSIMQIPSTVETKDKPLAMFITILVMMISTAALSFLASVMVHAL